MGYGPEDSHFVVELTYNYNIRSGPANHAMHVIVCYAVSWYAVSYRVILLTALP